MIRIRPSLPMMVLSLSAALIALAVGTAHAESPETAPPKDHSKNDPRLEACIKSVNLIGANMGHSARAGTESNPVLDFIVRASSGDYDVACELRTGLVRDVSPRVSISTHPN